MLEEQDFLEIGKNESVLERETMTFGPDFIPCSLPDLSMLARL